MPRIEDCALLGDLQSAALVDREGAIVWLCLPRFDSDACFAALLGDDRHGVWRLAPVEPVRQVTRRYRPDTLVLETDFTTDRGVVRTVDFMPVRERRPAVVRLVEVLRGEVTVAMQLAPRFGHGQVIPLLRAGHGESWAGAGPDALQLHAPGIPLELDAEGHRITAQLTLRRGEPASFVLSWYPSHEQPGEVPDPWRMSAETSRWWRHWSARCHHDGPWREAVMRSLITLKALTYQPTGGIVAAPSTSLPERPGGVRNWDYRFCWLRDATFALYALLESGYEEEARAWRDWLVRAIAGHPSQMRVLYTVSGERRMPEFEMDWLPGYESSRPVRSGNGAMGQTQLDVYGEVIDCLYQARRAGLPADEASWAMQRRLLDYLETRWQEPDRGIWEVRGRSRRFTHSRVMAWAAFDRGCRLVRELGMDGPLERWRALRDEIHREVCERGYNADLGCFTQSYGSRELDASLLLMPVVGFLPATDARMRRTIDRVREQLADGPFVHRYRARRELDGLPPGEGAFLACSFWMVDALALSGRRKEARASFERLLEVTNDVGLLSEQYDPQRRRLLGNFPQAFSHVALINTALDLTSQRGPAHQRRATSRGRVGTGGLHPPAARRGKAREPSQGSRKDR